ncbi:MAG: AzlC family ABC transporter permease [Alcaligenaceae bacterium]
MGLRAIAPGLVALTIWGIVTGVAMSRFGLTDQASAVMSLLVYAGSAQLTALPLIAAGAPLWLIFAAGIIVNLRFIIFGAALHPYFKDLSWGKRLVIGYLAVDIAFVVFMPRFHDAPRKGTLEQHWFFLGAVIPSWFLWQLTSLIGISLGNVVPVSWSIDFAATLALLALMLPLANSRPIVLSILAAAVVAWVAQTLPLRLGLMAAVLVGIMVGMWAEQQQAPRGQR